jgi:GT2 family glycosyltransferase
MHKDSVSVVIPSYNGLDLLSKNLPLVLKAAEHKGNQILEVIVVNDGSVDQSVDFIKQNFPQVKVVSHKKNRGFSSAVNTGVRSSKGSLIALINNDVAPSENFLVKALGHFSDAKVFAVSFHEDGYSWAEGSFKDGFVSHGSGQNTKDVHRTLWVSGGSGIFRRDLWVKLGGMDEKLFSPYYWEDIDLGYRALKRGYELLWEPDSLVFHRHESTVSRLPKKKVQRIQERNQLIFIWKNITSANLFRKHVVGLAKRVVTHPGYLLIVASALFRLGSISKPRRRERKECKISDEAIFASFR